MQKQKQGKRKEYAVRQSNSAFQDSRLSNCVTNLPRKTEGIVCETPRKDYQKNTFMPHISVINITLRPSRDHLRVIRS